MNSVFSKIVFTFLSISLLLGNTKICIDEHGQSESSLSHHIVEAHCVEADLCNDKHPSCEDITLDLQTIASLDQQFLKFLISTTGDPLTFPVRETYQTKLKVEKKYFLSPPLQHITTVVITT